MLGVYEKQGVRHGDGVVEVDGARCVELIDDVPLAPQQPPKRYPRDATRAS